MNLVSEVDSWTFAFLALIGKTELCSERAFAAIKSDDLKSLPPFWPEMSMMSNVLEKAWRSSYADVREALDNCIIIKGEEASVNPDTWERAQLLYTQAAWRMKEAIRDKISVLSKAVVIKAKQSFTKQLDAVKEEKLVAPIALNQWDQWLHKATSNHIESFVTEYPNRILHPQLERQLAEMMSAPDRYTKADMFRAKQKLDRIMTKDPYWENLPAIEVSRLWHAEGIMLASEKGIAAYQIVNPMDKRTCPVCKRLHGMIYRVEDVKQKIMKWSNANDPEEIKSMFPFPRKDDVARNTYVTQDDLKAKGFNIPPFHGRCRDEIRYLWRDTAITYAEQKPPLEGLRIFPGDKAKAARFEEVFQEVMTWDTDQIKSVWKLSFGEFADKYAPYAVPGKAGNPTSLFIKAQIKNLEGLDAGIAVMDTFPGTQVLSELKDQMSEELLKIMDSDAYIRMQAMTQAYYEKTLPKKINVYKFIPNSENGIKSAITGAESFGFDDIMMTNDAVESWCTDLNHARTLMPHMDGVVVRRTVSRDDIWMGGDLAPDNNFGLALIRNRFTHTTTSLDNIEKEVWKDSFNSIANPIKPAITADNFPQGIKYAHVSDQAVDGYQEAFNQYKNLSMAALKMEIEKANTIASMTQWGEFSMLKSDDVSKYIASQIYKFELGVDDLQTFAKFPDLLAMQKKIDDSVGGAYSAIFGDDQYVKLKALNDAYVKKLHLWGQGNKDLYMAINDSQLESKIVDNYTHKKGKNFIWNDSTPFNDWVPDYKVAKSFIDEGGIILKKKVDLDDVAFIPELIGNSYKDLGTYIVKTTAKKPSFGYATSVDAISASESDKFTPIAKVLQKVPKNTTANAAVGIVDVAETVIDPAVSAMSATITGEIPVSASTFEAEIGALKNSFLKVDSKLSEMRMSDSWIFKQEAKDLLGGAHGKQLYTWTDGTEWLFKPNRMKFVPDVEEAAYKLARLMDPDAVPVLTRKFNGEYGSLQLLRKDVIGTFKDKAVSALTELEIEALQREHILDWLVSNLDGHGDQFLRMQNGGVIGIDKGQAFKFFGSVNDKLDPFAGPGQGFLFGPQYSYPNQMFQAAIKGEIKVDGQKAFRFVKAIESLSETEYKDVFRAYAESRFGKGSSAEEFLEKVWKRAYNLRGDLEKFYGKFLEDASFKFIDASPGIMKQIGTEVVGKLGPEEAAIIKEAELLGGQGKTLRIDKMDIEDQNVLVWTETLPNGDVRTVLRLKVRPEADPAIMSKLRSYGIDVQTSHINPLIVPEDTQYAIGDSVYQAIKTINFHASDKAYNLSKINAALDKETILKTLVNNSSTSEMANYYLKWLEDIKDATNAGKTLPHYEKFLLKEIPTIPGSAPPKGIEVLHTKNAYTKRRIVGQDTHVVQDNLNLSEIDSRISWDADNFVLNYKDGTRIRYFSWEGTPQGSIYGRSEWAAAKYALRGEMEVFIEGVPTLEKVNNALSKIESLGINSDVATKADRELMYLLKQARCVKELETSTNYASLIRELDSDSASTEDRVIKLRDYWNKKLGVKDITKLKSYDPEGYYELGIKDRSLRGGYQKQLRFDLDDKVLEKEMKNHIVMHQLHSGTTAEFVDVVLDSNIQMTPTLEKIRIGIRLGGQSPGSDLGSGGASYFFTRILPQKSASSYTTNLVFKKSLLRRMDAISYDGDKFGEVIGEFVQYNRYTTTSDWKKVCSKKPGNETIFKNGVDLLEHIDYFNANSRTDAASILKKFKDKGIHFMPDGRPVEKVIRILGDEISW